MLPVPAPAPLQTLLLGSYQAIYADPAWNFENWSEKGEGKNANQHYRCMALDEIKALPVRQIAAEDCVLFLWVTDAFLAHGLDVMKAWGFTYKTVGFYWAKTTQDGTGWWMGPGYWTRANPEPCLLGTIGHPKRKGRGVRKLLTEPRREHSRKPDEARSRIERLVDGPYVELFARTSAPGWAVWGNEANRFGAPDSGTVSAKSVAAVTVPKPTFLTDFTDALTD